MSFNALIALKKDFVKARKAASIAPTGDKQAAQYNASRESEIERELAYIASKAKAKARRLANYGDNDVASVGTSAFNVTQYSSVRVYRG